MQKISDFRKNQHLFCENPEISQKFCKICDFLQIFATFSKKQLDSFVDLEKPEKMRIWLQNFVSIQPRTSLEKSDVSWPTAKSCPACARRPSKRSAASAALTSLTRLATTHHFFLGSFSAVSKRNFATKHSFFQVFRDL